MEEKEEPTLQDLFTQADEIINRSVNPPPSVEQADQALDLQIAQLVASQNAISSAMVTIATPTTTTTKNKTAAKNRTTPTLTLKTTNLPSLPNSELISLAKIHKFPGANKWSKNRQIGQQTKEKLVSFLQGKR